MRLNSFFIAAVICVSIFLSCGSASAEPKLLMDAEKTGMGQPKLNKFWWPEQVDLSPLRDHDKRSNPYGTDFDYAEEFSKLNIEEVKKDINQLLTTSQDWWPADFGNYGPFFIRMAWHSAGTYRTYDGRGGGDGAQMRFDPLNSWPDNANLDKARRLLWPVKKKYGKSLSWGDLMILTGNVSLENMGFETYGFAGGRADDWEPDLVYWGPEAKMMGSERFDKDGKLQRPLGATHMGLIYVNPEGPMGKPDPKGSADHIRQAFGRMAMNDEETVALIAGGHTFGKMHGAHKSKCLEREPGAAPIEEQGLGWKNKCGKGNSEDTVTSGLEGAWTQAPTKWSSLYLQNLLTLDWQLSRSPAGGIIWVPKDKTMHKVVPDAHIKGKFNSPVMTTADIAVKTDPEYRKIAERFLANPEEYKKAFARAWFKLTHRDMGPRARYLGNKFPSEELIWQDPVPTARKVISSGSVEDLKEEILESGLTVPELVRTAWAAASTFRASDMRGGANGGRIRLAPQKDWEINNPAELNKVLSKLKEVQDDFGSSKVSMADLVVIGGAAAVEKAARDAGFDVEVPVEPGRTDASQEQTDTGSFALLEQKADPFRNYYKQGENARSPVNNMVDKADQLSLTVPEMTVLIGGLRVLGANAPGVAHGVFTDKPGKLTNDFFVSLIDMSTVWKKSQSGDIFQGHDRRTGELKYTATPVDLVFGSSSELRAVAEAYASDDAKEKFVNDFIKAWTKVMNLDRYDLKR